MVVMQSIYCYFLPNYTGFMLTKKKKEIAFYNEILMSALVNKLYYCNLFLIEIKINFYFLVNIVTRLNTLCMLYVQAS